MMNELPGPLLAAALVAPVFLLTSGCVTGAGGGGGLYTGPADSSTSPGTDATGSSSSSGASSSGSSSGASSSGSSSGASSSGASSSSSSSSSSSGASSSGASSSGGAALFGFGPAKLVVWSETNDGLVASKDYQAFAYANGRLVESTDMDFDETSKKANKGGATRFTYDADGRLSQVEVGSYASGSFKVKNRWRAERAPGGLLAVLRYERAETEPPGCDPVDGAVCNVEFELQRWYGFVYGDGHLIRVNTIDHAAGGTKKRHDYEYDAAWNLSRWKLTKTSGQSGFELEKDTRLEYVGKKPVKGSVWSLKSGKLVMEARYTFKAGADGRLLEQAAEVPKGDGTFKPTNRLVYTYKGDRLSQISNMTPNGEDWQESLRIAVEHVSAGSSYGFERDFTGIDDGPWVSSLAQTFGYALPFRAK